jgi:hypothetical protein
LKPCLANLKLEKKVNVATVAINGFGRIDRAALKIIMDTPAAHSPSVLTLNAEQAIRLWLPKKMRHVQYRRNEFTDHNPRINEAANLKQWTGK